MAAHPTVIPQYSQSVSRRFFEECPRPIITAYSERHDLLNRAGRPAVDEEHLAEA